VRIAMRITSVLDARARLPVRIYAAPTCALRAPHVGTINARRHHFNATGQPLDGCLHMQAYDKLSLKDAASMLKFSTQQEVLSYAASQGWRTDNAYVHFTPLAGKGAGQENMDVFHNMLMYARELDRII
jgi:hypothetical protein